MRDRVANEKRIIFGRTIEIFEHRPLTRPCKRAHKCSSAILGRVIMEVVTGADLVQGVETPAQRDFLMDAGLQELYRAASLEAPADQ